MSGAESPQERRDTSPLGHWKRAQFDLSLHVVRDFGYSDVVVEHCRQLARETQRLPHEVLAEITRPLEMSGTEGTQPERRDNSPAGRWNRAQFDASLQLLRMLHLSDSALDYFRRHARQAHRLPHELLKEVVEEMALRAKRAG
jgi:hypothetical protein